MTRLQRSINIIERRFKAGELPALMSHVVLGFPTLKRSIELVTAMVDNGAAIVELQIPFSDPIADGPTIMGACEEALAIGVRPADCIRAVEQLRKKVGVPLLLMSYYNPVFRYGRGMKRSGGGLEIFCRDAAAAGADGLIIPDIPAEDTAEGYWTIPQRHGLMPIPLVSPVTSAERLARIKPILQAVSRGGFVYCISTTGTTGARSALPSDLSAYLNRVRRELHRPLAVGFGISTPTQIAALRSKAEIAVVGSATIDVVRRAPIKGQVRSVSRFIERLAG